MRYRPPAPLVLALAGLSACAGRPGAAGRGGDPVNATSQPLVQRYPETPGAARSDAWQVEVEGQEVPVERWSDVSYARLAVGGPVRVSLRGGAALGAAQVLPRAAVADLAVEGDRLRFTLLRPANLAVLSPALERLFLMADPPEVDPPAPGQPGVTSVAQLGADPTGRTRCTAALQAALDAAARRSGGGTVLVPPGTYLTGTLVLRGRVTLYLAPGALLRGSPDPADYPIDPGRRESGSDASIESADERYRGETMTFSRLLLVDGAEGARVLGRGTIDGDGRQLRTVHRAVPNLVRVRGGQDVELRDVLLRDAAAWTLHVLGARRVRLENLKILNDRGNLNTDGIDPDGSEDVTVQGCLIYTKDDGVCVKATRNSGLGGDVRRIAVRGNVVSSLDAALKVGTESQADRFEDVVFEDNDVFDSQRAMSVVVRDGAAYARIAFRRIRVAPGVPHLVEQVIGLRRGRTPTLGTIDDLRFEDVEAVGYERPASNWTWYAQFRPGGAEGSAVPVFQGADAAHPLRGLTLRGLVVNGVPLRDRESAACEANLTIGPFVEDVTVE